MALDLPHSMTMTKDVVPLAQYLTFSVAGEEYGIPALTVREILERDALTRVPHTPHFLRAVIDLDGRAVPVVDLSVRFGRGASDVTRRTCVVVVEADLHGHRVVMGLIVDAVHQIVDQRPEEIQPPPSVSTRGDAACLTGIGRAGDHGVLLLDIDRVLSAAWTDDATAVASAP
jgi:purine-binding chemotaxis protein CheW